MKANKRRNTRRPAEILGYEMDSENTELIRGVIVAAALLQRRGEKGVLVFVCQFCGKTHSHGRGGSNFGDGDGHRVPHCVNQSNWPSPRFQFILQEVEDYQRAVDFPKMLHKWLVSRKNTPKPAK